MTPVSTDSVAKTATKNDTQGGDKSSQDLVGRLAILPDGSVGVVKAITSNGTWWVSVGRRVTLVDKVNCQLAGRYNVIDQRQEGQML